MCMPGSRNMSYLQKRFTSPSWGHLIASTRASTQPMLSNQSLMTLSAAISMCSPPRRITKLFSPNSSGQVYCICFVMAYSGWSKVITGTLVGLMWWTQGLTLSFFATCPKVNLVTVWDKLWVKSAYSPEFLLVLAENVFVLDNRTCFNVKPWNSVLNHVHWVTDHSCGLWLLIE